MQTRDGFFNLPYYYEKSTVAISGGAGTLAVTFAQAFEFVPAVYVVKPRGAAGTYAAASVTKTGFTIDVSSETDGDFNGQSVSIIWFAHEKN